MYTICKKYNQPYENIDQYLFIDTCISDMYMDMNMNRYINSLYLEYNGKIYPYSSMNESK
jgi:hypothetical protein